MRKLTKEQIERAILQTAPPVALSRLFKQRVVLFGITAHLPDAMLGGGIDTPMRAAHFLAQLAHEADGFCTVEEYASGRAYEGRKDLGNTEAGDGVRFKGRGPIQCTGRHNYLYFGEKMGVDLIEQPELLLHPYYGCRMAVLYWNDRNLSKYADLDDLRTITGNINGGYNGLVDRIKYYRRASQALGMRKTAPLLKRGIKGADVQKVQVRLDGLGYRVGLVDGDFGPQTDQALRQFQRDSGLSPDGRILVGGQTWDKLFPDAHD